MKVSSAGVILALAIACAAGGYFLGRKGDAGAFNVAALLGSEKPAAPASKSTEPKAPETPRAVKPADRASLTRLLRGDEAKPASARVAEWKEAEPRPPADIPTPPAKPELGRAEIAKAEAPIAEAGKPEAARSAAAPELPEQPAPLAFALVDREVSQSLEDGERVTLSLNFENLAGKPIRAFEGVVKFTDQQDNNIYSSKISVSALISEGGALQWAQHVDARKLDGKSRRLVSEDKSNLRAVFLLKKVFFVDGSVQKYAMPPRAAQAG